ncbi:hypothetical protein B0T16DRAFT_414655 [Cercophora newfieldiana]|uniref:Bacteriophage T5 Orf172 DNA-binding domain-containing protein n=1 Tax=Cercophora newfieldiana TaxID=92897 RepID=A0AA39Y6Q6_9PEZI|nr:hypothetical protein B0T16DRAFT_414655 [Cercophora newfieldiana]
MTTTVKFHPDGSGRLTFSSSDSFRVFLGLQAKLDRDSQYQCMAWTASNKPHPACGNPLGKESAKIDIEIHHFCEAGFPSTKADECLWRIAFNSVCSINRGKHNVVVAGTSSARPTQYQHLYNTWHGKLWEIYHQEHTGIPQPLFRDDAVPPPLHCTVDIWRERATATWKEPPVLKRSWTASSTMHASGTRLAGLFSRLSVGKPRLRGKSRLEKRGDDAISEIHARRHSENGAILLASSINDDGSEPTEPPDQLPPAEPVQPATKSNDPIGPTTPIRPPLTRTEPAEDSHDGASVLIPSPDSVNSQKPASVFSRLEKDQDSGLLDTPFSDHSFRPATPIAESTDAPNEAQVRDDADPDPTNRDHRLRRQSHVREHASPTPLSRTRQPGFAAQETITIRGAAETRKRKPFPNLVLYYQSDVEKDEISCLQQKLEGRFQDVNIKLEPRAPPSESTANDRAAAPSAPVEFEDPLRPRTPTGSQESHGPQAMKKNQMPMETLRTMINKLHHPVTEAELSAGFVYGFRVAGDELGKCIKIGYSKSPPDRQQRISSKCKVELIPLFEVYMPSAPLRMESLVHDHLWERQRVLKCTCGTKHIEWFEVGLQGALESVLTWQEFSRCRPYEEETACLGAVWDSITGKVLVKWDYEEHGPTNPAQWVDMFLRPALRRVREGGVKGAMPTMCA